MSGIPQVPGALLARVCAVALEEGLEVEWVRAVIRRNRLAPPDAGLAPEGWPWAIEVHTLRRFGVLREGEPLRFAGRTHRRTLELLQALVALGGKDVPEERLAGALWPGPERGRARHALETTLHRLRRLLGDDRAVIVRDQRVSLDPGRIWVDALALDRLVGQLTEAANGGAPGRAPDEVARLVRRVRALHVGPFLPGSRSPHVEAFRARLEARVGQALAAAERHERDALPRRAPPPEPTGDAAV